MNKPIIAIDCDDVIIETAPSTLVYYNNTYGTTVELKDFYSNEDSVWGADSNTAIERINNYLNSQEFQEQRPFQEAIKVVMELAEQYELHLVTGRHDFLTEATTNMLHTYFPNIFKSVEFTNFFSDNPRSKAAVCSNLHAVYLIDDNLHHATVVAEAGIKVLLYGDYPWNEADNLHPNIRRVKDWYEIRDTLI